MPTASTKRRGAKGARGRDPQPKRSAAAGTPRVGASPPEILPPPFADDFPERAWRVGVVLVLALAAFLRLYMLELKPMHHDEGVNGWFLTDLVRQGKYRYDPQNYHGPSLYYFALLPAFFLEEILKVGMSTFAVRLVPAAFGVATVWLALRLRRYVGSVGALAAAALIAVSPGAVYYSRYFIHEMLFVFFTAAIVVAALDYYETGRGSYLLLAFASAGLLFATKETAFISIGVLGLAWLTTYVWMKVARATGLSGADEPGEGARRVTARARGSTSGGRAALSRFGGAEQVAVLAVAGIALFVVINVLLYSSFFTNTKQGLAGAIDTFRFWTQTGATQHTKPFLTYAKWLVKEEAAIFLLATAGACVAVVRARNRFALFAGAWAFGLLAAYSLVQYKTPWLALNFIVPLAFVGGYAVAEMYRWAGRNLVAAFMSVALVVGLYQTFSLNFRHYDDDRYPYVYAHTERGFLDLIARIEYFAARAGTGKETQIAVASSDYWPMPWYMRDYKRVGFFGSVQSHNEAIVVGKQSPDQRQLLDVALGNRYRMEGEYPLRPGVTLVLYVRNDILEK